MPLSWNEIKERAVLFSKEWEDAQSEKAEAQQFLIEFFNIFGISNRRVASFENKVKKLDEHDGFIDLIWKGTIIIEMKSRGKNLDRAYIQAKDYMPGLKEHELPKYILVCDFETLRLYDLDESKQNEFKLKDLIKNIQLFGFIAGYQKREFKDEDPVNIEAAYLMGKLHDALKEAGYTGHELEKFLVRLLFCLFAEDTGIFEKQSFQDYLESKTNEDGTDLGLHLAQLFQVLNRSHENRQNTLDETLADFPFVNGLLFEEQLSFASFNSSMRQTLLECSSLDWSKISPAIFGSMFQSVMNPVERRNLGAHYTSEKNILKLIKPLFLDKLWQEFETAKNSSTKLKKFHRKISSLRFLDPACGCGNFLVITYRELRLLELAILKKQFTKRQLVTNLELLIQCNVDRFHGIECEEFPAQIAQVALWLIDHQMNMRISQEFGEYFVRLPLKKSAKIVHGNALQIDWNSIIELLPRESKTEVEKFDYILGNPPFIGKKEQSQNQKRDMELIFENVKGSRVLDYVTAWYIKASQYLEKYNETVALKENKTKVAFVSTNSITQGEQVGILWKELFLNYKIKIHFAHRTFKWSNKARGNAAVHVVIIGFSNFDISEKYIFEYEDIKSESHEVKVKNINPYLVGGKDFFITKNSNPICKVSEMKYGSMPIDKGNLILSKEEKDFIVENEPSSSSLIRPYTGGDEFINNKYRWCIWLKDVNPSKIKQSKLIQERIEKTKKFRSDSVREATKKLAVIPGLFGEIRQPSSEYIIIPKVSSEKRKYIPIGILGSDIITNGSALIIPNATLYSFGVISSIMHMTWVNHVCGRMKSDYQYSTTIVYNNYPWPEDPNEKKKETVEKAAQTVLDIRDKYPDSSLADLYDPLTMPADLVKAHQVLDKAVDLCYRPQPFISESKRIEFLFDLYDKYTAGLFAKKKPIRKSRK